jgi:SAM-dependent methyltransferase
VKNSGRRGGDRFDVASDEEFVSLCFRELLGRDVDPASRQLFLDFLAGGGTRFAMIRTVVGSPEHFWHQAGQLFSKGPLADLRPLRPAQYGRATIREGPEEAVTFRVDSPRDFDWLEEMILRQGFYDAPDVWTLTIDTDKRILAEIAQRFGPCRVLEIGCSTGAVIGLLREAGILAEGTEVSHLALVLAIGNARSGIHFGDLTTLSLDPGYDLILGMDVFEHLNPNRLPRFLARCHELLANGGFLVANIPAFGPDPVFGEVFDPYLSAWRAELDGGAPFSVLHTDEKGWPLHGHLVNASWTWWQGTFESAGFRRETDVERALGSVYRDHFKAHTPARQTLYVFSKGGPTPEAIATVTDGILSSGSPVLGNLS